MQSTVRIAGCMVIVLLFALACAEKNLRGRPARSSDGKTYLVVDDDNGGACGPIFVDGRPWPYPVHVPGPITPGSHTTRCGDGGDVAFVVGEGTTFHFDYWGP